MAHALHKIFILIVNTARHLHRYLEDYRILVTIDITSNLRILGDKLNQLLLHTIESTSKLGEYVVLYDTNYSFRTITGKCLCASVFVCGTEYRC